MNTSSYCTVILPLGDRGGMAICTNPQFGGKPQLTGDLRTINYHY
jgi:hypothetical protein